MASSSRYNDGRSWQNVGGQADPIGPRTIFRIAFDQYGDAYAATNNGLFRWDASRHQWSEVLDPAGPTDFPPYDQQVTDVAVVPGTHGRDVITAIGWHGPGNTAYNGFYESTNFGRSFSAVTPAGDIVASDIGRTTFAYSADGSKLYAIVQSPAMEAAGDESVLQGVFVASGTGSSPASVAGPWKKIGDEATLAASGSALAVGSGYGVGIQAWYNQDLAVDPANPDHVYIGLEEVFESTNAGQSWVAASPYWNYPFPCDATNTCPNTTHPDQHAMMITDGKIVIGNDGGVYSRPLSDDAEDGNWADLNATLHDLQFYDARAGNLADGTTQVVGGMQDNGTMVDDSAFTQAAEPAGGDGFDVIVDPNNANNWVGEYTYGALYTTTDGGHTFGYYASFTCDGQATVGQTPNANCDPDPRFVMPLVQDQQNADTWVGGGEDVWVSTSGWSTSCATEATCDWTPVYDTGAGNSVTALSSTGNGKVIYAAWVANGGNPGPSFASGIATNYGGTWHQVSTAGLPDRYIAGVTVDPADPAHAYAIFNGYSRRFVPGGGTGHVFETWNGGQTWTDISGNLPDIASDALVLAHGQLALATDAGVYTARELEGARTTWLHLGSGLPNVAVDDLTRARAATSTPPRTAAASGASSSRTPTSPETERQPPLQATRLERGLPSVSPPPGHAGGMARQRARSGSRKNGRSACTTRSTQSPGISTRGSSPGPTISSACTTTMPSWKAAASAMIGVSSVFGPVYRLPCSSAADAHSSATSGRRSITIRAYSST